MPHVVSVNVAAAAPLRVDGRRVRTAIGKRAVDGRVAVRPLGLDGDEQADLTVHGGLSKAVYAYPSEHYPFWRSARAQHAASPALFPDDPLPWGRIGENLTLDGLTESEAWIGDVLRFPDCALVVSEPRLPCFKFDAVMGFAAGRAMVRTGRCGFYLSVREAGTLAAGETFEVVPGPREVRIAEQFDARTGGRSRKAAS